MKVMCISIGIIDGEPMVSVGSIYTVIRQEYFNENERFGDCLSFKGVHYDLAEVEGYWFHSSMFAPISEIDETNFVREYNKEKV